MKPRLWLVSLVIFAAPTDPARAEGPADSVVRVFATIRLPNPVRPWTKQNPIEARDRA